MAQDIYRMAGQCERHPTMGGVEVRLRRADGTAMRGFRIVACSECRARMTREGYTVIAVYVNGRA